MSIRVEAAAFLTSAADPNGWPKDRCPEVAFAGRSNVGKSSLINSLLGRRALVRVSSTPGRTRMLNFVDVSLVTGSPVKKLRMVDLPGYGYAKVSREERRRWGPMIETYIARREDLKAVVLVVDSRRPPSDLDLQMATWLEELERPWICVATKLDKVGRAVRKKALQDIERRLPSGVGGLIGFSTTEGVGKDVISRELLRACTDLTT